MAKPQNKHTMVVRNAVTNWIQRTNPPFFTTPMIVTDLMPSLSHLQVDLCKAVSNELVRRQVQGFIECVTTEVVGIGRPPKVYKQKWR